MAAAVVVVIKVVVVAVEVVVPVVPVCGHQIIIALSIHPNLNINKQKKHYFVYLF